MSSLIRVGVVGVGAMGLGIATRAHRAGFEVHARDVDPARERLAADTGLRCHPNPRCLAQCCDVIAIVVLDAAQIDQVLDGDDGLLAGLSADACVLLCSTIAPEDTARLVGRIRTTGADALDTPISGGPARATDGTMSMMIAGAAHARARVEPLLSVLAARRFTISDRPGDAARAKLVNNLLAGIHLAAAAEAMTLATKLGLDARQMAELVHVSSGQSWMFDDRVPRALDGDFAPRAQAHVLTKDLGLAADVAQRAGAHLPLGEMARDMLRATCAVGWRYEDDAAIIKYGLSQAGLTLDDLQRRR